MAANHAEEGKRGLSWTMFRYLVSDTLFSFLVSFLFFFFIFFVNQLLLMAQEILSKHVPFHQVALLILYAIPSIIAISAPFASLVGTLMTIGRLSSDNEILVMLAAGLSYKNVFVPALAVGIFISLVSFFANDVLLPAGTIQFSRLYRRVLVSSPALELEANSVKRFKDTVIVTGAVNGAAIDNLLILDRTNDGERRVILAKNAELKDSGREGLSLDLKDAFVQSSKEVVREDYDYASSGFLRYWVPQEDMMQAVSSVSAREMSSTDVRREIRKKEEDNRKKLNDRSRRLLSQALLLEEGLRKGETNANAAQAFAREGQGIALLQKDRSLSIYRLEYNKKFSIPFGALSFVFLAVPLGLMATKSGQTVGFMFGLIIAVVYWALLLGGQTVGTRLGFSPFWSMWFPNTLAVGAGLVLCAARLRR
ncbi:MAG: LptF/LptG family permease [Treponematales bacterium]